MFSTLKDTEILILQEFYMMFANTLNLVQSKKSSLEKDLILPPQCFKGMFTSETSKVVIVLLAESCQMGREHGGKRKKCSLRTISPFSTVFSKDLYCRHVKSSGCLGKG